MYYLRYKNQNLILSRFDEKTGNVISIIFFSALSLLLLLNFSNSKSTSSLALSFLFLVSLFALVTLMISNFIEQKDLKIILSSVFLVSYIFLFTSFLNISFSNSKSFSFIKSLLIFFVILFAGLFVVFLSILNFIDDSEFYKNGNNKANAGVILGAAVWGGNRPSPVLRERINKGYEIYSKKTVPKLVITGGGSPNEMTEADVEKNVLIKYGVDSNNLIVENSSNSTIEQIHFVRDNLYKTRNWSKVILISDNFHLMRASEICKFNNINADGIASDKELSTEGTILFCLKESLALIIFWIFGI